MTGRQVSGHARRSLRLVQVVRWTDHNDHEGQLTGDVDGHRLTGRVVLGDVEHWNRLRPGTILHVDMCLQRSPGTTPERLATPEPASLVQGDGVTYEAVGPVRRVLSPELLVLEPGLPLLVDLDTDVRHRAVTPDVGSWLRLRGSLEFDLDPAREP